MTARGRRRPRLRAGLGPRLALALVATSLATLAAATVAMVPLLEQRFEDQRLAELRDLARTARPALRAVPVEDVRPGSRALHDITARLQRRTGGRVAVYDEHDRVLAETSPRVAGAPFALPATARARALRNRERIASGEAAGQAFAVAVAREGDDRLTLVLVRRLDDRRIAARVVRSALPPALVLGLVVAIVLAFLLSHGLLRRLGRLHADARALGAEGLDHPVAVRGRDEVAVVAEALEDMRVRLVEQEASRQAFVATASHELRTPLASLQATLELLREEASGDAVEPIAVAARADAALRQTHRLTSLATDLLDLSRLDGGADLRPEPIELAELATAVAREFEAPLQRAGRALEVRGGPSHAVADPAGVARILRVLLENAVSYGRGAVRVGVEGHDGLARIDVSDDGPGVPGAERERIFLRFARGAAAPAAPGAGLGLPIARGLARVMGGDVAIADESGGACFVVTLPAWERVPTQVQPPVEAR